MPIHTLTPEMRDEIIEYLLAEGWIINPDKQLVAPRTTQLSRYNPRFDFGSASDFNNARVKERPKVNTYGD